MSDLVEFIRARLDEDEALARGVESSWRCISGTGEIVASDGKATEVCAEAHWEGVGEHIARHDPARVLREVEAKRALLDLQASDHDSWFLPWLALPYSDHPDYRSEWSPS